MSSSIFVGRTRARSQAIQILFQAQFKGVDPFDLIADESSYVLDDGPADAYALQLVRGVAKSQLAIDRLLSAVSTNWNLNRMPLVDRIIMAIAIHEMFDEDTPTSVAISEAVEIAKVYGTDDSSSFVNGILGRIARLAQAHPDVDMGRLSAYAGEVDAPAPGQAAETAGAGSPQEAPAAAEAAGAIPAEADVPGEATQEPHGGR